MFNRIALILLVAALAALSAGCSSAQAQCPGGACYRGAGVYSPWGGFWYWQTPCGNGKCNTAQRPAEKETAAADDTPAEVADTVPELVEIKPFPARVIELVNAHRRAAGLPELVADDSLCNGCEKHSRYMQSYGFGHAYGIGGKECIAMGAASPDAVVRMWLNSQGHRAILLGPGKMIGAGCSGSFWTLRVR